MLRSVWGKKIGMTQIFSAENIIVPVTVIDLGHWVTTGFKNKDRDGYDAVQVGRLRDRYVNQPFSADWLKKQKQFFAIVREVRTDSPESFEIGKKVDFAAILQQGEKVNVSGLTKGRGFQGVVKRHGFRGGSASHGPRFGRWPGSMGFMRSQGRVIKGKRLPGHMGVEQRVMRNLEIVKIESESQIALVKGSVPGHTGSLILMQKV